MNGFAKTVFALALVGLALVAFDAATGSNVATRVQTGQAAATLRGLGLR